MSAKTRAKQTLLATMTNEPFQPVRIYYVIPNPSVVTKRLRQLECFTEDLDDNCWQWLYHAESASLPFSVVYDDIPKAVRPIILGRIRFPNSLGMTLETNSIPRAIEAARFFAPLLGPEVVASRCRVINRCFAVTDGHPDALIKRLDRKVTVIDPRRAEDDHRRDFKDVKTMEDAERVAAQRIQRRLASGDDVPLVEDFPLAPEEETADFRDLSTALGLRLVRALEHWRGNTHVTLVSVIMRVLADTSATHGETQR